MHPYDTGKAAELGVTYSTEKEEDALGVNVVKATAICEFARGLTSNGGTSVDVIIERGTAHGAFKCGYNVGCWAASARNGLHLTAFGRQFGRVVHVDGTTWTSGLWRQGAVPTKRERVELVETIVPDIDQRLRGMRQAQREGMAQWIRGTFRAMNRYSRNKYQKVARSKETAKSQAKATQRLQRRE